MENFALAFGMSEQLGYFRAFSPPVNPRSGHKIAFGAKCIRIDGHYLKLRGTGRSWVVQQLNSEFQAGRLYKWSSGFQ
jgi:hypothetical protein